MKRKKAKSNTKDLDDRILKELLEDPTRSMREISKKVETYRQTLWRKKKNMEKENIIWGYTAVVDEGKQGKATFLILMKLRPMIREMAETMVNRIKNREPEKKNVRLIDAFQVNGEYDLVLRFSAPDHSTARTYYDTLRAVYADHLLEKPVIVDINFVLVAEGKTNPEIDRLFELVISP
ncbi:MAG: Lrp/AsnC family transcriptional regulator [Candidatus Thermoplasmatota archaeon]|nr:Lrp/AsnC family transcriptional regulator [Candidatus Thermoplasmatota archaeon]